ncbi:MAG TPA: MEDS domain-containing protein [Candidatus Angelobacter sp.]|nr:MEDS domain-containing protein [Candidatus Angelobacter sp.]
MRSVSSLVQFKRGDHICIFYRDEHSLVQNLVPYIAAGLRQGERCFCAQKPRVIAQLLRGLEAFGVDTSREAQRGALEIHTEDEVYFTAGRFEPQAMIDMLERSIDDAVSAGFSGFRTAGELSWALEADRGDPCVMCDQIVGYEAMVQRSYPGKPAIGVCQYPAHLFPPDVLRRVLEAHCIAIEETMVSTNHSTLTLRSGGLLADIVTDRVHPGEAFHYVVQQNGSPEILSWGQEPSMDAAIHSSETIMADLSSNRRAKHV